MIHALGAPLLDPGRLTLRGSVRQGDIMYYMANDMLYWLGHSRVYNMHASTGRLFTTT